MTVPKAMQHPVLRRYPLRRHRVSVKGGTLSIVCPTTMEVLVAALDDAAFGRGNELMPYWADVWASSVALAREVFRGPELTGLAVLDLGCGVGVAGSAAHARGARVDFADVFEDALAFALFNAAENAAENAMPGAEPCGSIRFDWFQDELPGHYDRILAADVAYEERNHEPLRAILERNLAPGGQAWVADPGRAPADAFFERVAEDFDVELVERRTFFPDRHIGVRLARIRNSK